MHRLPSLCSSHEQASPTKCENNIVVAVARSVEWASQFCPLEVFSNGSGLYDPVSFSSSEGPSNAHIGRSILRRADITSRHRYREPEGRQWQIHVCHAHHCRAA